MDFNDTNRTDVNVTKYDNGGHSPYARIHFTVASAVAIALCLFGLVGNVIVFWFLTFKIKRNKYTVYIVNLAVADFIFLLFSALFMMIFINTLVGGNHDFTGRNKLITFMDIFYNGSQYSGMFFLMAISLERCLSAIFPMWYHCYRPKKLSSTLCTLLWIVGWTVSLIENLACPTDDFSAQRGACTGVQIMAFIISIGICLPLMVISSLILFIVLKRNFPNNYPPKLYIIIIIAVGIFVLSVVPFNILRFLFYFQLLDLQIKYISFFYASVFGTVLNSTINPYMYFLVGRQWRQRPHRSILNALQNIFIDSEEEEKENT